MPQRVCSLASIQPPRSLRSAWRTSSQRQTRVSGRGRPRSRGESAKWWCSASAKPCQRARCGARASAAVVSPTAAWPAMAPSTSAFSLPPKPVHSPAANTPGTAVACTASTARPWRSLSSQPSIWPRWVWGTRPKPQARRSHASTSSPAPRCSRTDCTCCVPVASSTWLAARRAGCSSGRACTALAGQRGSCRPKPTSWLQGACSAMRSTWAPASRAVCAAASSSGPVPAMTMRWPRTGSPALMSACRPPAPVTPGSVQPGKGSSSSRAPVHRMRRPQCWVQPRSPSSSSSAGASPGCAPPPRPTTRVPVSTRTLGAAARRSRCVRASGGRWAPGPSRQIWPPGAGLSSTSTMEAPLGAAASAAAMPAGPAPMMRMSQRWMGAAGECGALFMSGAWRCRCACRRGTPSGRRAGGGRRW